jgi:serine phosphatase RsbU (regulator of sigma subunit)
MKVYKVLQLCFFTLIFFFFLPVYCHAKDSSTNNAYEKTIRNLEKEVRHLRNDKIYLNVDVIKQGYEQDYLAEETERQKSFVVWLALMLFLVVAFVLVLVRSSRAKQKYLNLLQHEKTEVSIQKELVSAQKEQTEKVLSDLKDSIRYAMRIQNAVLTDPKKIKEMLGSDFFILFKPKDIVSWDFYFVEKKDDWFIAAVADCTGHGVPGALLSMLAITMLNDIILKKKVLVASEILNELREKMILAMRQNELLSDQNDGLDITLLLLNRKEMIGQWSGANTPLIQVHKKSTSLKEVKADKRPIGDYPDMSQFTNHRFELHKGDRFYLFSDGYADQFGGPNGKKFMKKRFKSEILQNSASPMIEQKKKMSSTLQTWLSSDGNELGQVDDITVFGIEI